MQFQKLSIQTTPTEGIGISWGWWNLGEGGGSVRPNKLKKCTKLNRNSVGDIRIFLELPVYNVNFWVSAGADL